MAGDPSEDTATVSTATTTPQVAPRRKFAVEPVEISSRSSKAEREKKQVTEHRPEQGTENPPEKLRRKFLPQPVEETSRSSRRGGVGAGAGAHTTGNDQNGQEHDASAAKTNGMAEKKPRKFAVQPVETVKRVRRRNTGPALQPGDRTDELPGEKMSRPSQHLQVSKGFPSPPANSPSQAGQAGYFNESAPQAPESRFSYASLSRKASRQQSMRKPTLEPISSVPESEESNFSKRSSSSNSSTHEDWPTLQIPRKKRQPKQKESYEEGFSGFLLDMAARAAQQQLREQVAEAYPNERLYEPVDHFAVSRESDSDTDNGIGQLPDIKHEEFKERRESSAGWDAKDLKRHREMLEEQKNEEMEKNRTNKIEIPKPDPTRITPKSPRKDPFGNPFNLAAVGVEAKDPELSRMQEKARPPMLGGSLVFPKCQSPRTTLIDPLQHHGTRRNTGVLPPTEDCGGLWAQSGVTSPVSNRCSPPASICLWSGSCTADQAMKAKKEFAPKAQTGIMTPQIAPDQDPFERYANDESLQLQMSRNRSHSQHQLPSDPGSRMQSVLGIDQLLAIEQRIEQEYPDAFVTQIYNYLSLGYPAIARSYDEELSRISKVSIEEIRRDDARKNTKGYVGAPEGNGIVEAIAREESGRWRALRLYIREWARQQPNMMDDGADNTWGARARRGSWFA